MTLNAYKPYLDWISSKHREQVALLEKWANINSSTDNLNGLKEMSASLIEEFSTLRHSFHQRIKLNPRKRINHLGEWTETPLGDALAWKKNTGKKLKILLAGHMDTVYPLSDPFQKTERISPNILKGPGVADMKGGLVILLTALQAVQKSPFGDLIDWEILINPDEEVGSPGSSGLFAEKAKKNTIGLIFEPSFPDGALVSSRKGSSNWTIVARGRAAHVGRDFQKGRNALTALAKFLLSVEMLTDLEKGLIVNIGNIEGGGPVNVVPSLAIGRLNVRVSDKSDLIKFEESLADLASRASQQEGFSITFLNNENNLPKPFDDRQKKLFNALNQSAKQLNEGIEWRPSGGACDGSRLYNAGLPNIDTLGAIGGEIHSNNEYIELDSLTKRAQLTALFIMQLAAGEIKEFI